MNNNDTIYVKLCYKCHPSDAPWTGAATGCGVIIIDTASKKVSWTKTNGTNPYWWQVIDAIMRVTPSELYQRENRIHPFNVHIREGYTGCEYIHLNLYRRLNTEKYVHIKCGAKFEISSTNKVDNFEIYFGDLVEIARALYEKRGWEFSRNPRTFKQYNWCIDRFANYDIVDAEEVYDPTAIREAMERDPDRRDPNHHRSHHRNRSRAFNHG